MLDFRLIKICSLLLSQYRQYKSFTNANMFFTIKTITLFLILVGLNGVLLVHIYPIKNHTNSNPNDQWAIHNEGHCSFH